MPIAYIHNPNPKLQLIPTAGGNTMELLSTLWLPIVLSGVALFFASFLAWMVLPHHKGDFIKLPDEGAFENAL